MWEFKIEGGGRLGAQLLAGTFVLADALPRSSLAKGWTYRWQRTRYSVIRLKLQIGSTQGARAHQRTNGKESGYDEAFLVPKLLEARARTGVPVISEAHSAGPPTGAQKPQRLYRFVMSLMGIVVVEIAICAAIPEGHIPEHLGFLASSVAALLGLGASAIAAKQLRVVLPVPVTVVAFVAMAKMAVGLWIWDTYFYDTETQRPRPAFAASDTYQERQSDVGCLAEIVAHWRHGGLRYIGEDEAYISINNRPPAHLAALIVRAYGMRYHAYFPFVAFLTGLGAIALMAALLLSDAPSRAVYLASWLAVLWPFSLNVGSVMKDVTLSGFVMLCAAMLYLGQRNSRALVVGVVSSFLLIAPFRPAYAIACLVAGLSGVFRKHVKRIGLIAALAVLLGSAVLVERVLNVRKVVDRHAQAFDDGQVRQVSKVLRIPVAGKVIYAFGTPFPWSQVLDDELKIPMVFFFAQQVVTLAILFVVVRERFAEKVLPRIDDAAVLAAGMMTLGIVNPTTAVGYVHVGVIAALPYAANCSGWRRFGKYFGAALGCFLAGNALWLIVR